MSRMTLSQDTAIGSTLLPNYFIDEYMKDANDAQIKVYLFLLRLMTSGKDTSISDIADEFNYTEKDIMRAIAYWEKKNLLHVEYDADQEIRSLVFLTPQMPAPIYAPIKTAQATPAPIVSLVKPTRQEEKAMPSKSRVEKNEFSLDQLSTMKTQTSFGQILSVAEVYLGRQLGMSDIQSLAFIFDTLEFSFDLIDYLLDYCVGREKRQFTYIEEVARNWHANGISTVNEAKEFSYQYNKNVFLVMKALGRSSTPTQVETDYVKRWFDTYGFNEEIVLEACERTVRATDKNRFGYAEAILAKWHEAGVLHMSDIAKADEEFAKSKRVSSTPQGKAKIVSNNYQQPDYDYAAIVKELTGNS